MLRGESKTPLTPPACGAPIQTGWLFSSHWPQQLMAISLCSWISLPYLG
jgi:hypothetical protein